MKYYSTKGKVSNVSFQEAITRGLPADNGLYMPETIPLLAPSFFEKLPQMSLAEIGLEVAKVFIGDEIPHDRLSRIVEETVAFDIPLKKIEEGIFSLELFHGPTLAFKDVGARFLARCLGHFSGESKQQATVLVATSGDTGSAVAHGFLGVDNINVVILYPKGKVSELQEKQFTTLGHNITALEIEGTFDDCQALVKQAFLEEQLRSDLNLTSANSINMARLIPQSFYYFWAYAQYQKEGLDHPLCLAVPSGNYGNLTAGLIAKRMGLPIDHFLAVSNLNDTVPLYLKNGVFAPKPSVPTISNAMDVGNPSNFARMADLYANELKDMQQHVTGYSFDDKETAKALNEVFQQQGYLMDPHGAVAYLGLKDYLSDRSLSGIFLETAHPAKFLGVVEDIIKKDIAIPENLKACLSKEKKSLPLENTFSALKSFLTEASALNP